ncbi:hypothetical protein HU200_065206 [Digitaria exilis]|uniref:NB-ARC domain-containing protein n=1 Tax=Digitaria exilis TaxID=1010633 RepID=A0A835DXP4_9POAL|nr:hypothetical protein HU200_065206 [Digitaria exilis]
MYDATDILDLCQLEAEKRRGPTDVEGSSTASAGCFQPLLFCLRNPVFAHKIGSQIKELNLRLENIHKEADRFKFNINLGSNPEPRKLTDAERSIQKTTSEFNESSIVGEKIEQDTRELAQLLITSGNHDIKVVSIVGTGGMGKTTLAQKIFNETTVQEHFKMKVWLSITQHFDEVEMLRTAIEHAGGVYGGTQDKTLLTRTLTNTLSGGRFLMVLDDVWSDQAWSHVLSVPIRNACQHQPGNWVLITTRFGDLAERMGASFYQHHVKPLNDEDAWSLLNKQLPPSPNQIVGTGRLKDIGMKIINKCGGLPLAVKVMGGLLCTRSQTEREWEAVLNHRAWSISGLPDELDSRIYLSYEDLSPQLKQCFLYCSLFPKGTMIWQADAVPMWIGSSTSTYGDRLEEVATEYYEELITRNLIEPIYVDRYSCKMHDVVRSFAEFMAREDSLVVHDNMQVVGRSDNDTRLPVRRMSVGPSDLAALQNKESLRTLIIRCEMNLGPRDSLTSFTKLRVLFINKGGDCERLVDSICELRHLRYLCLRKTNISRLPEDIHRMKFLQHIVIRGSRNLVNLPSSVTRLVHLRTLNMHDSNVNVKIPKGFRGLTNLRVLFGFPVHMDDMDGSWCSLEEIGPLSHLRYLSLCGLENVSAGWLADKAMISSKGHLDYLELNWSSGGWRALRDEIKKKQLHAAEEVLEKLCSSPHIQHLHIQGYFGRILPNWLRVPAATGAFKSLMLLRLEDLLCCTKLPDGLCRLPSLKALEIKDAPAIKCVGSEFQQAASSRAVAFPNLETLGLEGLCQWEQWDWEDDVTAGAMAMPALCVLAIKNCKLSRLPPGLATSKRHALRKLFLYQVTNLACVENFPSVLELDVFYCPELKRISGLSGLHRIRIVSCPNVEVLEGVPSLNILVLEDVNMEALPGYLRDVTPRYLKLDCNKKLYESIYSQSSCERDKIRHIGKQEINCIEDSDAESDED